LPAQAFLDLEYVAAAGVDADAYSVIARHNYTVA
jgi:hypothetical protein